MQNKNKNILLSLIGLSLVPFLLLFLDIKELGGFFYALANVSGFIGGVFLFWQILIGVRGVLNKITTDYTWNIKIHRLIGIYAALFILLHPILEMFSYTENWLFLVVPNFSNQFNLFLTFGKFAFILFLFVWITSVILKENIKYKPWLYIHYLSYPLMFFVIIHAFNIGTYLEKYPLIKAYWMLLVPVFIILLIIKFTQIINLYKIKYSVEKIEIMPGENYLLFLKPLNKKVIPKPGQFFYIKRKFWGDAHPFTVMEYDENTGRLVFGVKAVGDFTKKMEGLQSGNIIYLDGPYGSFTVQAQNSQPKVLIAAGIGITPFIEIVKQFSTDSTYMFYCNQKIEYVICRNMLKEKLKNKYFDFLSRDERVRENIINGHISKKLISQKIEKNVLHSANYFICGNDLFIKTIKKYLTDLNISSNKIYYEEFSF